MLEANIATGPLIYLFGHPGFILWALIFFLIGVYLFYKSHMPEGLILLVAGGLATLIIRIISRDLFQSFIGFFTDLARH